MSLGSRIVIGVCFLLGAISICILASQSPMVNPIGVYGFALFCLLVSISCFGGRVGVAALRLVAAGVFAACVGYVFVEVTDPGRVIYSGRQSQPSLVNAILAFCIFGLPSAAYAIYGEKWRKKGEADEKVFLERLAFKTRIQSGSDRDLEWFESDWCDTDPETLLNEELLVGDFQTIEPLTRREARQFLGELFGDLTEDREFESLDSLFREMLERCGGPKDATYHRVHFEDEFYGLLIMGTTGSGILINTDNP